MIGEFERFVGFEGHEEFVKEMKKEFESDIYDGLCIPCETLCCNKAKEENKKEPKWDKELFNILMTEVEKGNAKFLSSKDEDGFAKIQTCDCNKSKKEPVIEIRLDRSKNKEILEAISDYHDKMMETVQKKSRDVAAKFFVDPYKHDLFPACVDCNKEWSLNEYQTKAISTIKYKPEDALNYTILGLAGEAGELAGKFAKVIRDNDYVVTEEVKTAMIKELGDIQWMVAACAHALGITLQEVCEINYDKLQDRQTRGVLSGSGDDR